MLSASACLIAKDDKNKLFSCTSIQRKTNFPTVSTPAYTVPCHRIHVEITNQINIAIWGQQSMKHQEDKNELGKGRGMGKK